MFTDIKDYTAIMRDDELLARKVRDKHRLVIEQLHEKFDGEIVNYFGDGSLSLFNSSVQAVECAMEMQLLYKEKLEVPVRIGIHSGDVVLESDSAFGDAVNIASRVESFSIPGAVMISDIVYEQVRSQKQIQFKSLGR